MSDITFCSAINCASYLWLPIITICFVFSFCDHSLFSFYIQTAVERHSNTAPVSLSVVISVTQSLGMIKWQHNNFWQKWMGATRWKLVTASRLTDKDTILISSTNIPSPWGWPKGVGQKIKLSLIHIYLCTALILNCILLIPWLHMKMNRCTAYETEHWQIHTWLPDWALKTRS